MKLGHLHQLNDWNWKLHDSRGFDPYYELLGTRQRVGSSWVGSEVELEFGIPHGLWTVGGSSGTAFDLHGMSPTIAFDGDKRKFLGEIWPNENCAEFGIDIDDFLKTNNPTFPVSRCGNPEQSFTNTWRPHFGRGLFVPMPLIPEVLSGPASTMTIPPAPGTIGVPISLDLEDWGVEPHRIGFLGQPILDCGHWPYSTEIHPAQIITMPVMRRTYTLDKPVSGLEIVTFGWSNITVPRRVEFDLWPPPRPGANFELVAWGGSHQLSSIPVPLGQNDDQLRYGYVIDDATPQRAAVGGHPTLVCLPFPLHVPNHLHCEYDDPSAGTNNPVTTSDDFGNPRMTPFFGTSRFELRAFLGWRESNCTGTSCGEQSPAITVDASPTFQGPDICLSGRNFTPGATILIEYRNVPPLNGSNFSGQTPTVLANGTWALADKTQEQLVRFCTPDEATGDVTVVVTDGVGTGTGTGRQALAKLPRGLWCSPHTSGDVGRGCFP
jgi:hypothetical protein